LITDPEGVQFLQWCLPRLHLRWAGFRKVRRQVYKRINHRLLELGLPGVVAYRDYLEKYPGEWTTLDTLCWISISRFYRDQGVFRQLETEILPQLAGLILAGGKEGELRLWSAGCAGGEEPYTLAIIWKQRFALRFPLIVFRIVATDIDPQAIRRAQRGCYQRSSIKELPVEWCPQAFVDAGGELCLKDEYRGAVRFMVQDIRVGMPPGTFHLILCRNLVFTYFDEVSQQETLHRLIDRLVPGGALITGKLESLPKGERQVEPWPVGTGVYRKPLLHGIAPLSQD
jgi:chemotaxis protein methyltransferase CheR